MSKDSILTTRNKIIKEAVKLFNTNGFGSINLLEIAKKLEISRGNLTYHFKEKDNLLEAIADEMWTKIEIERAKSRQLPSFENLHNEIQLYYKFQKEYSFIFLDQHVLTHPCIKNKFRKMTQQTILDIKSGIAFSINLGNVKPEKIAGIYNGISFITWMLTFFWHSQSIIRGEKSKSDGEKMIWSLMIPYFTEKGIQSFKKFFGENFSYHYGVAISLFLRPVGAIANLNQNFLTGFTNKIQ